MKEENPMSTMADDDINNRINAGRKPIEMSREEMEDTLEPRRVPPGVVAAGIGAALLGVGLIAWMLYRRRQRRTLLDQLQAALPERVSDLRELGTERMSDLRDLTAELRARLKKAL
jgi:hypothetical protein